LNRLCTAKSLISRKEEIKTLNNYEMLIILAKNGDEDAFSKLIEHEKDKIYRIAYIYVQNENDAIEVFQQSIVKAYMALDQLMQPTFFNTWLTRIVINCSITYIQKRKKIHLVEPYTLDELEENTLHFFDEQIDLWKALCELDEKYKTPLILRYYQDYSVAKIAEILNFPEGTVKTNIRRGLQILRKNLKGAYLDEWVKSDKRCD
jgi:RNA polymerase sigma-70 factor (ECF subfamily)